MHVSVNIYLDELTRKCANAYATNLIDNLKFSYQFLDIYYTFIQTTTFLLI